MNRPRLMELLTALSAFALAAVMAGMTGRAGRDAARQAGCAWNLSRVGAAAMLYSQTESVFPALAGRSPSGAMKLFDPHSRDGTPEEGPTPSPTADLWLLVRGSLAEPENFICPATTDSPDPVEDPLTVADFAAANHLSFAYHYQHSPYSLLDVGPDSVGTTPFLADGNPYIKGGVRQSLLPDRASRFAGNSVNHPQREGQNVAFVDGHVRFHRHPTLGLPGAQSSVFAFAQARDNIFTYAATALPGDPGTFRPSPTTVRLTSRSDVCLVP